MATEIVGSRVKIYEEDVSYQRPVSEALLTKLAQGSMYAQDHISNDIIFSYEGRFRQTSITDDYRVHVIKKQSTINHYILSLGYASGTSSKMDIQVYDSLGASRGSLFSTAPYIVGTKNRCYVGYDNANAANISGNLSGMIYAYGALRITTLNTGDMLVSRIIEASKTSKGMSLMINIKEV